MLLGTLYGCCPRGYEVQPDNYYGSGYYNLRYDQEEFIKKYVPSRLITESQCDKEHRPYSAKCQAIFNQAFFEGARKCLQEKNLTPPECTQGIEFLGFGAFEGGWGETGFRCK